MATKTELALARLRETVTAKLTAEREKTAAEKVRADEAEAKLAQEDLNNEAALDGMAAEVEGA